MKIRLTARSYAQTNLHKNISSSIDKIKTKKTTTKKQSDSKKVILNKSVFTQEHHPKIISIVQQKTEPCKKRIKKQIKQEPQILREFEEITRIYQNSQEIENQEELSLLCLDQTLDEGYRYRRRDPPVSVFSKYSEKSISQLPSIAQKDAEQQKQDDFFQTIATKAGKSIISTATNTRTKNTKSANQHYVNEFSLRKRAQSSGKKLNIDVQTLIKSRSKTKSSMSNRSGKRKNQN